MKNNIKITVFTPTYNRAYIIENLYNSLIKQSYKDFEWLIVDDGSTDNTEELLKLFTYKNKIAIRWIKTQNGGKHRAINIGIQEAKGQLFFIVDSDDYLYNNALELINYHFNSVKEVKVFGGVCGLKTYFNGKNVGGENKFETLDCNALDFRFKYKIRGDMAEVFRIEVLKEFSFPEIEGEKFCPEALVWNRIAQKYNLRYFNEKIYYCDYLPDGLSAKIVKLRMKSPEASKIYYSELYHAKIPVIQKIKAAINYWRFAFNSSKNFLENLMPIGILSIFLIPISILLHLNDLRK